jgi:phthiocerol/phenolphthiocerol synthesis type-I polyketide synthase D
MSAVERAGGMPDETSIRLFLMDRVADRCRLRPHEVDPDRPMVELGLSSRDAMELVGELEELTDRVLPPDMLYEFSTITRLARALTGGEQAGRELAGRELAGGEEEASEKPAGRPSPADRDLSPIAVIGLGCRFPGGIDGPEAYWRFLLDRGDAIKVAPATRRERLGGLEPFDGGPDGADRLGGFLDDIAGFDSRFFGITPDEADVMDPQQRLVLEVAWEALEHAGIAPTSLRGSRTGVFVGISAPEYGLLAAGGHADQPAWATGAALSIAANRLSYLLDLRGPSLSIDTACSSSLVATHLAVQALRGGQIEMAIAGGVNVLFSDLITMAFERAGGIAPDGRCKAFDASADGMVRAEGCGMVILKRLADAHRDGDRVLAVIRNTAVNCDGRSNGLAAPNPEAQRALLREAYTGLEPPDYVEAHGTGTLLGDPIEAHALGAVLGAAHRAAPDFGGGSGRGSGQGAGRGSAPLLIGSVKTNLGHLEPAAGVAGLIKTVLALRHRTIPPSLHFLRPNPHVDFTGLGLRVVTEQTPWPAPPGRAGVSAFGFGGTNAHVVLEEYVTPPAMAGPATMHTLVLSDVSAERVAEYAGRLAQDMGGGELGELPDVAHTLARRHGRGRFGAAIVGRDRDALVAGLRALHAGRPAHGVVTGVNVAAADPVWVFSGYGGQHSGMTRRLRADEPAFARTITLLEPLIEREAGFSVREALADATPANPATGMITLFAVQVGLARLWQAYGVEPAAVIGHSMGEVAAAVIAGALSLQDGVKVIAQRASLLRGIVGGGAMAVIDTSPDEAARLCADQPGLHVAVRASPGQTIVTGDTAQVRAVVERVERRGLAARVLRAEGAGHSPQVEPLLPPLRQRLAGLRPAAPGVKFYSTVLADPREPPACDADYWADNLRGVVRFVDAVRAAGEDGHRTFVEISARPVITRALAETIENALVVPTLRRDPTVKEEAAAVADDTVGFHAQLALLKLSGLPVRLGGAGRVTDVPTPAWRHRRHWIRSRPAVSRFHPLLGPHAELPGERRHVWTTNVGADPPPWRPVHGVTILPAAAYAEIALAAGAAALGTAAPVVAGLRVVTLLPLADDTTITTVCGVTGDGPARTARVDVRTRTPAGTWTPLAEATVTAAGAAHPADQADQADAADANADAADAAGAAGAAEGVEGVAPAAERFADHVTVPPAERPDRRFMSHPLVLDRCLAAFGGDWTATGIGYLRVAGPTEAGGRCELIRPRVPDAADAEATAVAGLRLLDDAGSVVLEARDIELRRLPAASIPVPLAAKLFEAVWIPADPPRRAASSDVRAADWLLITGDDDDDDGADAVARQLTAAGQRVAGRHHLTAADDGGPLSHTSAGLINVVVVVPARLVDEPLLLAMARLVRRLPPVNRLWILIRGALAVRPGEAGEPGQAFLGTLTRVIGFEHPALRATLVDVDDLTVVAAELLGGGADTEVAWREGVRHVARLRPARLCAGPPRQVVRPGGAYVISGGYGGLGLVTARRLSARGAGRVVLCGRSGPPPAAQAIIDELRAMGTEVEIVRGDIAAPGVAERMIAAAGQGGLRLRGVVHAAAGMDDRLITDLGEADVRRVWSPKVGGALRLHEATKDLDLDWWVTYSSAAALFGSPGQSAYATANARVDALVGRRRAAGLPAATINWGPWAEVGGAAGRSVAALDPITPQEGADALEALLAHDRGATGVLRLDLARLLPAFPEIRTWPYFAELAAAAESAESEEPAAGPAAGGDDWPGPAALEGADPDTARRLISARVDARVSAVLGFTPEPDRPLTELGLDSLVAVRIKSALERDLGRTVPTSLLLRGATLAAVKDELTDELFGLPSATAERRRPVTATGGGQDRRDEREDEGLDTPIRPIVRPLSESARRWGTTRPARPAGGRADPAAAPFFCVHAAGGDSDVYAQLTALLGEELPSFGLDRFEDAPEVPQRAARYIRAIRAIQPEGPYRLGGWSFGGVVAYEMARQLGAAEVALVALLDAGLPKRVENPAEMAARRYAAFGGYLTETYGVPISLPFEELVALGEDEQLALVVERTRPAMALLPRAVAAHQFTSHEDTRALERYRPEPYDGRVVLYRSTEPTPWTVHDPRYDLDEANGFAELCPHLEIIPVPGAHHLNLLDQPSVQIIARHLRDLLTAPGERHGG